MKKIIILIFLTQIAYGQDSSNNSFVGKWEVVESFSKGPDQAVSDEYELSQIFLGGSIDFNSNGNFKIDLKSEGEFAKDLIEMTMGTKWRYSKDLDWIMVGTEEDDYTIIGFQHFIKDKKSYLKIPESGIVLQVKKIK
ncbi:hypothetical protein [Flagellimonas abyssi]|uniref:Lipocalin-like domain-containing protein n=1 Tax=Flagellimonas abyssi TaxID=2864871 RepID=A0ABS7EN23_9FLAO|nr:hypothetical protein [Allomuricauda abyssi]MBW8198288.1 hypothetical protein [Allomuricauda abyssi]